MSHESTDRHWTSISELRAPYNDATNYRGRAQKAFFHHLFLRTDELESCLSSSVYFLMGEKGAGKTAYAVYLENNEIDGHRCKLTTMTETQYKRFIELKKQGKLGYSDYANIWRSMLLFLTGRMLVDKSKNLLHSLTGKFSKVEKEVSKWSKNALNPEVESAFEALSSHTLSGHVALSEQGKVAGEAKAQSVEQRSILRHHLLETESSLKEAISSLKLNNNHVLFIDGVDYRPETVSYADYIGCIKGLGEAVWQLNTEFFNRIKDSPGRIKIVLLVRPDVFHALNLYNSNSRLQDNCVFLDWSTTEKGYAASRLYEVGGKYFSSQQKFGPTPAESWEHYYHTPDRPGEVFRRLLRNTFQKPRDILTFVKITQNRAKQHGLGAADRFPSHLYQDPSLSREYSDYLLGEVKNYAAFYMTHQDFAKYLKIFQYLDGKSRFNMGEFSRAFDRFRDWADGEVFDCTTYLRDAESLIQFLYDVNAVGYREIHGDNHEQFFHWSYKERSVNNIAPQIKTTGLLIMNPGLAKALDVGKEVAGSKSVPQKSREFPAKHRANKKKIRRRRDGRADVQKRMT